MKSRVLRSKSKAPKIAAWLVGFMLLGLLAAALPGMAAAAPDSSGEAATSLTIRVAYPGDDFTVAQVFTDSDFADAEQQAYSFMDSMPSPCIDAVTGIPLTDLLESAGIDVDEVKSFAFYTTDVPDRPCKTMKKSYLYASRYYYPHIMEYWNRETQSFTAADGVTDVTDKALEDAEKVPPMICISDNWVRGAMEPDFSTQDSSTKYRLVLGQPRNEPTEITAPDALKWICQIDVTVKDKDSPSSGGSGSGASSSGSASSAAISVTGVTLDQTTAELSAGSTCRLTATISPAGATNQDVTWSSSNAAVATVNSDGLVTAVAPGAADITVTTADTGKTAVCKVTVTPLTVDSTPVAENPAVNLHDIAGHWAENSIATLVARGAAGGYPDGSFKPDKTITRAEFAAILVKAFRLPLQSGKEFADTSGHWAQEYISTAGLAGIVSGYSDSAFGPDDLITREQMAVMLVKAAGLAPAAAAAQFADSGSISGWAGDAVVAAAANGVMKGYPDATFRPQGNATRAEAVTAVLNALTFLPD